MSALDPASLAVLVARLAGVAEEVGAVLRRAAFSPNIKERADCSAALFTAGGELLVQAEHIPVHLGSMPASVAAAIAATDDGRGLRPGDQVILNDPFAGGTHLNDVTLVAPVHVDGRVAGWVANRAHHADLGGAAPGSIPADATEIHQEGLRIPPMVLTAEVRALLVAASRTPQERAGDLDAQAGANAVGVERFAAILATGAPLAEVIAYGERRMRAALTGLPDGTWRFADVLDSTGAGADLRLPARVELAVTVRDDTITFDFTGTDPQSAGNVNAVEAVTVSCVAFALRSALDPTLPSNAGTMRPVRVVAPAGAIVNARYPAAVGAGNVEVSQRVADVCLGALAQLVPDRVGAAGQGTMGNLLVGGDGWVYYETIAGGQGARPGDPPRAGMSGVHTGMTNTKNTPIEALERAFPMRVLRSTLRRGSGGRGLADGGDGIEREIGVLEDVTVSLICERQVSRPWGLAGGEPGAPGESWLLRGGEESRAERLPDKVTVRLAAGDVLRLRTPGGGGWGMPPVVVLRSLKVDDIAAVQALELDAGERFRAFADERIARCADHPPTEASVLEEAIGHGSAWAAVEDGVVVGFAFAGLVDDSAHLEEVAVSRAAGRRGVASALLDQLVRWARGSGCDAVTLTTFSDVPFNRPFYERRGFRVVEPSAWSPAQRALMAEEAAAGLDPELRVLMHRPLREPLVRDARADDVPAILAIYNAVLVSSAAIWRDDPETLEERRAWFAAKQAEGWPVLVAELDGEVVGFTSLGPFRAWPGYWPTAEHSIHVAEGRRGAGIGRTLLEALMDRAREMGKQVIVAGVDGGNDASVAFHERLGFREVARMPAIGRKHGENVDLVLLQREL